MLIVAGLNLKSLHPYVWDQESPHYLPDLKAVMVSYADLTKQPAVKRRAMDGGLHKALGIPKHVQIYLDNGSFHFSLHGIERDDSGYESFVRNASPDWKPIPHDVIPIPSMTIEEQQACFEQTMQVNRTFQHDGYVPILHVSRALNRNLALVQKDECLSQKSSVAIGGIVPHLLRTSRAHPHHEILDLLKNIRNAFPQKQMHLFGVGGNATLHMAALIGMDSVDSSGWRNRAARGIVQLPGTGDRVVADLGAWKGRAPSEKEWKRLCDCPCPACCEDGLLGLKANKAAGFRHRATHNLWTLLQEARWIEEHRRDGDYLQLYDSHLENSIYRPLIDHLLQIGTDTSASPLASQAEENRA
ncbi:MAG: hypothetical protein JWL77_3095 [Chthonomonadaceae bacterium]|nr:hypothetical protein [Chthonomonadaceae bacterium]